MRGLGGGWEERDLGKSSTLFMTIMGMGTYQETR